MYIQSSPRPFARVLSLPEKAYHPAPRRSDLQGIAGLGLPGAMLTMLAFWFQLHVISGKSRACGNIHYELRQLLQYALLAVGPRACRNRGIQPRIKHRTIDDP